MILVDFNENKFYFILFFKQDGVDQKLDIKSIIGIKNNIIKELNLNLNL